MRTAVFAAQAGTPLLRYCCGLLVNIAVIVVGSIALVRGVSCQPSRTVSGKV